MIYSHSFFLIAASLAVAFAGTPPDCPINGPLSCHVKKHRASEEPSCCIITAGRLLQTQFWDAEPAIGPPTSWTIHGLWPDNCDKGYPQHCDYSPKQNNITDVLIRDGAEGLLRYMEEYWKPNRGSDEKFWQHEWNKHGTCVDTLAASCYRNHEKGEEVVDYFERAVYEFKKLPTYQWLAEADILPSEDKEYWVEEVEEVLSQRHGADVTIRCNKQNELNEVWYYFNVRGSLQSGEFVPVDGNRVKANCKGGKLSYPPKRYSRSHKYADGLDKEENQLYL